MRMASLLFWLVMVASVEAGRAQAPVSPPAQPPAPAGAARGNAPANPNNLGPDANGNPLRRAVKTGHVSNYDEAKVAPYILPDPLVMANGQRVTNAAAWKRRRAELLGLYKSDIFGRVPATVPKVGWAVIETDARARDGAAVMKRVVGTIGTKADAPRLNVTLYTPSGVKTRVPVILLLNFGGGSAGRSGNLPSADPPVAAEILARGWGYAMVGYQDIQPDRAGTLAEGAIGASLMPGQALPAADEWGAISAWAWGASRIIDYLATDANVDATRIALQGFSRLGKAALWASAQDERVAAVFAACAGEMGSALSRRDWGETVDDMAQNFPWWFNAKYQQWPGRWNEMPVDAHMLIALSAPRPVFLTGGTSDQWADPKGMFLTQVAAGPVYRLLGAQDLGVNELPPLDTPVIGGHLGWYYHTGPHAVPAADWTVFLDFLGKTFK